MLFFLERWDGHNWTALVVSPEMIAIDSLGGPQGAYPSGVSPGNMSAFAGVPGSKARIRHGLNTIEEFDWDKVPVNPLDADSDTKWGWKSVYRNYGAVQWDKAASAYGYLNA